jgi:hypothetical protein
MSFDSLTKQTFLPYLQYYFLGKIIMRGEFEKRIEALGLNDEIKQTVLKIIESAGAEFPCLHCGSNDTCENFQWYLKWFSNKIDNNPF